MHMTYNEQYDIDSIIHEYFQMLQGGSSPHRGTLGHGRQTLATLFRKLKYTLGAEIDVANGVNSNRFFNHIPNLELFCNGFG